jgi:hypothetical protein
MSQRESVKAIANPKEFYIERYASYVTPPIKEAGELQRH